MRHSTFLLLSLAVVAGLLLAACGSTPTPLASPTALPATQVPPTQVPVPVSPIPFPAGGRSVTGAWSQEPDNLVPYYTTMPGAFRITQFTLAGLAEWDNKGNYVPELAAEIPTAANGGISSDGLTITWQLRAGLKWSDGEPLTSADVLFTWQSVLDPKNAVLNAAGYDKISSIDTPDAITIVLHFKELFPAWQQLFSQGPDNPGAILPEHILQGKTGLERDPFIRWPTVASGPWVISEWVPGDHLTLLPNPYFYAGRPKLDRILIKFVPDSRNRPGCLADRRCGLVPGFL